MLPLLLLATLYTLLTPSSTLPSGAPVSACTTMLPFHGGGIAPMANESPFEIRIGQTSVRQGEIMFVFIESTPAELSFGGFMIQARVNNGPFQIIGTFNIDAAVRLIDCDGFQNTATHSSTTQKSNLELSWTAPNDFVGQVVFR